MQPSLSELPWQADGSRREKRSRSSFSTLQHLWMGKLCPGPRQAQHLGSPRPGQIVATPLPLPHRPAADWQQTEGRAWLWRNQKLEKLSAYPLCPSDSSVEIVNLARILLNEGISLSKKEVAAAAATASAVKLTQNKSEKANSHNCHQSRGAKKKKKRKEHFLCPASDKVKIF